MKGLGNVGEQGSAAELDKRLESETVMGQGWFEWIKSSPWTALVL